MASSQAQQQETSSQAQHKGHWLVFPGQGSQYPGMGKSWVENFKVAREAFEEASDYTKINLKKLCFEGSESELAKTEVTQPAILTTTVAVFRSLHSEGKLGETSSQNTLFAGHSLGEFSALVCAGALELGPTASLVQERGRLMQSAVPEGVGAMAALIFRPGSNGVELAEKLCQLASEQTRKYVSVANYNTYEQIVVSGEVAAVEKLQELSQDKEFSVRKAVPLKVSAPFHCQLMKAAAEGLLPRLQEQQLKLVDQQYIANCDAKIYSLAEESDFAESASGRLFTQVDHSVYWAQSMETALETGFDQLLEIGPGAVLSGMAKRFVYNVAEEEKRFTCRKIDQLEDMSGEF